MSINSAMLAGVSGLVSNSSALAAISDNIANANTIGYKRSQANFQTLVPNRGATTSYTAGGVTAVTRQYVTQQGLPQRTTSSTDLAIAGNGFFVTTEKAENVQATDTRSFTRAGSFHLDELGYLKNDANLYLQGWLVDNNGNIATDPSDMSRLQSINVAAVGGTAQKTTRIGINANLQASQTLSPTSTPLTKNGVVDSAAATHNYKVAYHPTGPGQWNVTVSDGTNNFTGAVNFGPPYSTTLPGDGSTTLQIAPGVTVPLASLGLTSTTDSAPLYNPANNSMAAYNASTGTGVKPDFSMQVPVSDSKGGKRTLQYDFLKSDTPNQWYVEVHAIPASDVQTGPGLNNGQVKVGKIAFTQDGRLDWAAMAAMPAGQALFNDPTNVTISFGDSSSPTPTGTGVKWASGLGVSGQDIQFDIGGAGAGGLTQFDSQSVVQSVTTNGTAFGNLTSIEIDQSGFVTAIFDNGVARKIAQVAVATFPNPDGLKPVNGNAYRVTLDSGTYNLKPPGNGGAGFLSPSTLEASTVDLSSEFTGLITTQRAYSASSKIISTADQMLQELLDVKR
ncbi:flagellar hook protein FlgE [Caulobacter sp. CCUG 60055]|uniref:flagellar hook protein FlgE n=3 Tax=Pseudomonadota TaxID=1224 RepID=UPI001FA78031|nr:flagellar hook protein FlgE [Caulobacter sp. CCUG 60055]MCI3182062.1 flagellar hook protein FlgE [Caulobacter sp. CCUG 60055]